jgi:NADH dehydrogenase FAD-containing subunit
VVAGLPFELCNPKQLAHFPVGRLCEVDVPVVHGGEGLGLWGFPAWLAWLVIHLVYPIEFANRLLVLIQGANTYISRRRGSRLITDGDRGRERP